MKKVKRIETVIFGGAFNPPTLAHLAILQGCIDYARERCADVWIMPSGNRTDKTIPTGRSRRLEYIQAMIDDSDSRGVAIDVLTVELDRPVAVETYDTVIELSETYPDRDFTWFFGADSTETMAEWKGGTLLLNNLRKVVVEREGSTINPLAKHVTVLPVNTMVVSSTEVRQKLAMGEPVVDLVSPRVAELVA